MYEVANKPKTIKKKKKELMVEKKRKREENKQTKQPLSEKKGEARNVSEQRDKGCT